MDRVLQFLSLPTVRKVAQLVMGVLFLVAALGKLSDLNAFAREVHNFRMLHPAMENVFALTLPWIELIAALSLLLGIRPRSGALVVAVLMSVFTVGVAQAIVRNLDITCGCFGTADAAQVGWKKLGENVGMTALSLVAYGLTTRR